MAGKAKAVGYETKREEDAQGMASNSKKKMNVKPR